MGYIDLHVHSNASDGSCSPTELVNMACEKGLTAFALTDHDTTDGITEALGAARSLPVRVIPGIEVSAEYKGQEVHILGLNIKYRNRLFEDRLKELEEIRRDRNLKMCEMLRRAGVEISLDELCRMHNTKNPTRGNFAEYLVSKGYAENIRDAFDKYVGYDAPYYIPRYKLPAEEASDLIRFKGEGVSVLAHPVVYKMSDDEYDDLFKYMHAIGVKGVEAIYSENTPADEAKFTALAKKYDLFVTGGSDFHGTLKPDIEMGTGKGNLMIPSSILKHIGIEESPR